MEGIDIIKHFLAEHPSAGAYLVGGAVRDQLLGRPCKDVDFVLTGVPRKEIESWFRARGTIDLTGSRFGVYKFQPHGSKETYDIALPRTEQSSKNTQGGYRDFDVQTDENLSIESDLSRRDFTVNAMAQDLKLGGLVDPFGGQDDLEKKIIRAVRDPNERFQEDMTRMLRGIRFAAQLGFTIEETTWNAIVALMPEINRKRIKVADAVLSPEFKGSLEPFTEFVVPREMVAREVAKALHANARYAIRLLRDSGAIKAILPDVDPLLANDEYLAPLVQAPHPLPVTLALLVHGCTPERARALLRDAGFGSLPGGTDLHVPIDEVGWVVEHLHAPPASIEKMRASEFERQFLNGHGRMYVEVLNALGHDSLVLQINARAGAILQRWKTKPGEKIPTLVSGGDVLALPIPPGPRVRELLDQVRDAQLDGKIMTREEALALLQTLK